MIANFNTITCDEFIFQSWKWPILIGQFQNFKNTFTRSIHSFKTFRISCTLDATKDEKIYSEETAKLVDEEEMDNKFHADTKYNQLISPIYYMPKTTNHSFGSNHINKVNDQLQLVLLFTSACNISAYRRIYLCFLWICCFEKIMFRKTFGYKPRTLL